MVPLDFTKAENFVLALKDSYIEFLHGFYNHPNAQDNIQNCKLLFYLDQRDRQEFAQFEDCVFEKVVRLCPDLCFPAYDISESPELVTQYILPYAIARIRSELPLLDPFMKIQNRLIQDVLGDPSPDRMSLLDLFSQYFQPSKVLVGVFLNQLDAETLSDYLKMYRNLKGLTSSEALTAAIDQLHESEYLAKFVKLGLPVFAAEELSWGELISRVKVAEQFSVDVDALDDSVRDLSRHWQKIFSGGVRNTSTCSAIQRPKILVENKWNGNSPLPDDDDDDDEGHSVVGSVVSHEIMATGSVVATELRVVEEELEVPIERPSADPETSGKSENADADPATRGDTSKEPEESPKLFSEGHLFVLTGPSARFYDLFALELHGKPPFHPNYYCTCARIRLMLYVRTYPLDVVRAHVSA